MCRFASPCSVPPLRYSCDTCLNFDACGFGALRTAFISKKARPSGQLRKPTPSPEGLPHNFGLEVHLLALSSAISVECFWNMANPACVFCDYTWNFEAP